MADFICIFCFPVADWLSVAKPTIEQRISRYAADEIHFNLMAIISDKITQAEQKIQLLTEVSLDSEDSVLRGILVQGKVEFCILSLL